MKVLVEHGYIYIAAPPLYLVKKGAQKKNIVGMTMTEIVLLRS